MKFSKIVVATGWLGLSGLAGAEQVIVQLKAQADLSAARAQSGDQRGASAYASLASQSMDSLNALQPWLEQHGLRVLRRYSVVNALLVEADAGQRAALASNPAIAGVIADRSYRVQLPVTEALAPLPAAVEGSLNLIGVPRVWALGIRGAGVTVASQDTGVQWDHPALRPRYRGVDGVTVSHAYNWHDAIHATGSSCGANALLPCDDNSHGSHTVGTMVGEDGANQVGVAPDAKWIACRNMNAGDGTPATYLECMDFMLAPTDSAGANPRPDLAPHVINNSWGCPVSEGCDPAANGLLQAAVDNLRAAGILFVAAAGNSGSACSTVSDAPAFFASSLTVGNTTLADAINGSSSRGPAITDGSNRLKPDLSAPGTGIRSTVPGSTYGTKTGTSMASPHIAGVAALVMAANPDLRRSPEAVESILKRAVVQISSTQTCGAIPGTIWPNNVVGAGRIDAWKAVQLSLSLMADGFE